MFFLILTPSILGVNAFKMENLLSKKQDFGINSIIDSSDPFDGYILYTPIRSKITYLINNEREVVHTWKSNYSQGLGVYLLENGNLIRSDCPGLPTILGGGFSGRVEMFDWNSSLIWEFEYMNKELCLHNDIEPLPNGNILMIAWELKNKSEAIGAGLNPDYYKGLPARFHVLLLDHIIEVEPTYPSGGNIVWEWHIMDHLIQDYDSTKDNYGVVADHPELIDINYRGITRELPVTNICDFSHLNSVDYNEEFDQILLSARNLNEIWVIDHNTTTEEAAGHTGGTYGKGGDLLYRWGNPEAYRAGSKKDQKLFGQHDARWIEEGCPGEGNITIFNNGYERRLIFSYSSVEEIVPPVDGGGNYYLEPGSSYGPKEMAWTYTSKPKFLFYSGYVSGALRLSNGNTLICGGGCRLFRIIPIGAYFFEVTSEKKIIWRYINPYPILMMNSVMKFEYYPPDYPGLGDFNKNLS